MIWRKPYRIYVGQPLMSTSAVAHTKCGFKLLHTIHHIIHMDNSVQWTMTPHGRNCLTTTSYHILPVNSTSGHTTLTVHGDSAWSTPTLQACWVLLQEMSTFGCWRRRSSGLLPLHSEKEQQKRPLYGKALGKQPITPPFLTFMFIAFGLGMFYNSFPCPFDSLSVAFLTRVDTTSQDQLLSGLKQAVLQLSTC